MDREEKIKSLLPFGAKLAGHFAKKWGHVRHDEMLSAASIAIVETVDRHKEGSLEAFAYSRIKGQMVSDFLSIRGIKQRGRKINTVQITNPNIVVEKSKPDDVTDDVEAIMDAFTPDQQNVIRKHFIDGLTVHEICRRTGLSRMVCRRVVYKARKILRARLTGE